MENGSNNSNSTNLTSSRPSEPTFLAVDVYYRRGFAFTAGVTFSDFSQSSPSNIYYSRKETSASYIPGEFYTRELPCITQLLEEHNIVPNVVIIDGYVFIDRTGKKGLGAYLAAYFNDRFQEYGIIGVAKSPMHQTPDEWKVYRGKSKRPLYVDSIGLSPDFARLAVSNMAGEFRIPTILKLVDQLGRNSAKNFFEGRCPNKDLVDNPKISHNNRRKKQP